MKFIFILSIIFCSWYSSAQVEEIITVETEYGTLEGTLTIPPLDNPTPVVLLIAGSGPSDRDGNNPMLKMNYLKLLSRGLIEHGISTLRYDKRGNGKSIGTLNEISEMTFEVFIDDANKFKNKLVADDRFSSITVLGHSQGSLIGMLISREGTDKYISCAGAGRPINHILKDQLMTQSPFIGEAAVPILDKLSMGETTDSIPSLLASMFGPAMQPFLISWMKYDPALEIKKLSIPTLILQGTTDFQVSMEEARILIDACSCDSLIVDGMSHILKPGDEDREKNMASYYDEDLPLHEDLIEGIVRFIKRED